MGDVEEIRLWVGRKALALPWEFVAAAAGDGSIPIHTNQSLREAFFEEPA